MKKNNTDSKTTEQFEIKEKELPFHIKEILREALNEEEKYGKGCRSNSHDWYHN